MMILWSRYCACLIGVVYVFALPAWATDISGRWSFQTGKYAGICSMSGSMTIDAAGSDGTYDCQFVTQETCGVMHAEVEQTCSVLRSGDKVTIKSKITHIRLMKPAMYGYAPDDWNLTIVSAEEMTGFLDSYHDARALFFRTDVPIT